LGAVNIRGYVHEDGPDGPTISDAVVTITAGSLDPTQTVITSDEGYFTVEANIEYGGVVRIRLEKEGFDPTIVNFPYRPDQVDHIAMGRSLSDEQHYDLHQTKEREQGFAAHHQRYIGTALARRLTFLEQRCSGLENMVGLLADMINHEAVEIKSATAKPVSKPDHWAILVNCIACGAFGLNVDGPKETGHKLGCPHYGRVVVSNG
jgi:hypothetical protein